jgi:flagellar basal body L-ring protein FlgH
VNGFCIFLCVFFSGCASFLSDLREDEEDLESGIFPSKPVAQEPPPRLMQKNFSDPVRATKEDFVDQSQEEGSLWASSGQTNYFFTKNKIRSPGDLISIVMDEELQSNMLIEVKKNLTRKDALLLLSDATDPPKKNNTSPQEASKEKTAQPTPEASESKISSPIGNKTDSIDLAIRLSKLDLSDFFKLKSGDSMLGEVLIRYSNGNYKIKGTKKIHYKQNVSLTVSVVGLIKSTDINEDTDKVNPGSIYEYEIQVSSGEKT